MADVEKKERELNGQDLRDWLATNRELPVLVNGKPLTNKCLSVDLTGRHTICIDSPPVQHVAGESGGKK